MRLPLGPAGLRSPLFGLLRRNHRPDIIPADHQPLDGAVFDHDAAEVNAAALEMPAY